MCPFLNVIIVVVDFDIQMLYKDKVLYFYIILIYLTNLNHKYMYIVVSILIKQKMIKCHFF